LFPGRYTPSFFKIFPENPADISRGNIRDEEKYPAGNRRGLVNISAFLSFCPGAPEKKL
jgi:hypothetical protein